MADLATPTDGERPLDPEEVADRTFPTAFRGFDPVQVRSFLQTVADELRRLQAAEETLRASLEARSGDVQAPAPGDDAVALAAAAPDVDVEEARAEAERLVKDARDRVATLGAAATAEATRVLEDARAEAARLRATATDGLKGRFDEAEATAVRKIAEAEREAAAIRVKAREESDATIEAARARGREMVAEAQAARERMLADLAKRKRAAQSQLEQLRAGRDRLLDTLKVARRSIDEMTTRFDANEGGSASTLTPPSSGMPSGQVTTTPGATSTEARPRPATTTISTSNFSEQPRPVRSRAVAIGEAPPVAPRASIAAPQAVTSPSELAGALAEPSPVVVESRSNPPSPPVRPAAAVDASPPPAQERRSSALRILRRNKGNDGPKAPPPLFGRDSPAEGVRIIGRSNEDQPAPGPESAAESVAEHDTRVESDAPSDAEFVEASPPPTAATFAETDAAADAAAEEEDVDLEALLAASSPPPIDEPALSEDRAPDPDPELPEPMAREEIRPRIEDLFARIRADREAATASAREVLAATASPTPPPDASATETERTMSPVLVAEAPASDVTSDVDEGLLQTRDAVIEPLAGQLTKRMKRALQDEQNASLDRLRTSRSSVTVDHILAPPDEQRSPYRTLATPFLEQAARAGSSASRFGPVSVAIDDLAAQLADDLAGALRSRLATVLTAGASEEFDLSGIGERISSVYRDWKVQKLERLAMHYLVAAHERGGFLAHPEGTRLRWLVDDGGPCPDCEDNALAGPTPRGETFPTGQLHPPAHLGCRCLLTPVGN